MNNGNQHSLQRHPLLSLFIAILLHLAVIVLFMNFKERNPLLTTFDPTKVYPVQVKENKRAPASETDLSKPTPIQKKKEILGSITGVRSNTLDERGPANIKADGAGDEIGESGEELESVKGDSSFDKSILYFEQPTYPEYARENKLEGSVTVRVKVTPEGVPLEPKIIRSSGHQSLDEAAVDTSLKWRFHPREKADFILLDKTIVFKLKP
jgi:TonB family protein